MSGLVVPCKPPAPSPTATDAWPSRAGEEAIHVPYNDSDTRRPYMRKSTDISDTSKPARPTFQPLPPLRMCTS